MNDFSFHPIRSTELDEVGFLVEKRERIFPLSPPPRAASCAGPGLPPKQVWDLLEKGEAILVDVRTAEERKFVGYVPGSLHVAWANGISMTRNPRFLRELEAKVQKDQRVFLLCRSGKRSRLAVEVARRAGFTQIANVLQGFEGELDDQQQRGRQDGWRYHGLPWLQD